MDEAFVALSHVSVNGFLFKATQKNVISGLSGQTLLAMTVCTMLLLLKKLWYPMQRLAKGEPFLRPEMFPNDAFMPYETGGWLVDAGLLFGCTYSLLTRKGEAKPSANDKDCEDDFGRHQMRWIWFNLHRRECAPPAYMHWCLVYVASAVLTVIAGSVSTGFSIFAFFTWMRSHPTGIMAIFINLLRGIGLLPQLHMSRRAGHVCPGLAIWMALMGAVDLLELLVDGIFFSELCYVVGDLISFVVVSDFMWLFVKSRFNGKAVVEIPLSYEV